MPSGDLDGDNVPDCTKMDEDDDDTEEPEEGDRIFAVCILVPPPVETIAAMVNISQRLAEAFQRNNMPKSFQDHVLANLHDFKDVFLKTSFDTLPEQKPWDHTVELIPDADPKSCKVYPLLVAEQAKLDKFLEENLRTGHIRLSKSPMASPFFFIKKKDGVLQPVQDYRALNAMTVKNWYPLPLISKLVNQLKGAEIFH